MIRGDIARRLIAEEAGLAAAAIVVIADDEAERVHQVGAIVATSNPHAAVFARTHNAEHAAELLATGTFAHVVADDSASVDALVSHALGQLALPERLVEVVVEGAVGTLPESEIAGVVPMDKVFHPHLPHDGCEHVEEARSVTATSPGCAECMEDGTRWVHLRVCLVCGHVGCCDSSPRRHARAHFHDTGHALMASLEPGEAWAWCFVDRVTHPTDGPLV